MASGRERAYYDTLLTYANTFAASLTTSWRAAVAAVSGVPALTTPNFGDHAASTVRWSIASPRMVRARASRSGKRDL